MRIAVLSNASVVHTRRWCDALAERGHALELISLELGEGYGYPLHHLVSAMPVRALRYPLATRTVRTLLERFQPDVVNAHFVPNYGLIGVLAGRRPLIVSVWGSDVLVSGRRSLFHRARARFVLERADAITTDAEMLTRAVIDLGGAPERILTVPFGVDIEQYDGVHSRRQAAASDPAHDLTVISTRKLEPIYNVDLLVEAVPGVLATHPRTRFVIAGDGPLRARYEDVLSDRRQLVEFLGMIPHARMAEQLAEAEVYVSTSLSDSTSVSLLEAMAAGCFPVVTDIEANHEWIEDGVNGFLVPVDRPDRLAERIGQALADSALRDRARRHNAALIAARASWRDNVTAVEELFVRLHEAQGVGVS